MEPKFTLAGMSASASASSSVNNHIVVNDKPKKNILHLWEEMKKKRGRKEDSQKTKHSLGDNETIGPGMTFKGHVSDSIRAQKTALIPSKRAGSPAFDRKRLTKKQMTDAAQKSILICHLAEIRERKLLDSIASRLFESDEEEKFHCPNCPEVFSTGGALSRHKGESNVLHFFLFTSSLLFTSIVIDIEWNLCKNTVGKIKSSRKSKLCRQQCPHCKLSLSTSGLEYHLGKLLVFCNDIL